MYVCVCVHVYAGMHSVVHGAWMDATEQLVEAIFQVLIASHQVCMAITCWDTSPDQIWQDFKIPSFVSPSFPFSS